VRACDGEDDPVEQADLRRACRWDDVRLSFRILIPCFMLGESR
jgi:hypothetical protein